MTKRDAISPANRHALYDAHHYCRRDLARWFRFRDQGHRSDTVRTRPTLGGGGAAPRTWVGLALPDAPPSYPLCVRSQVANSVKTFWNLSDISGLIASSLPQCSFSALCAASFAT